MTERKASSTKTASGPIHLLWGHDDFLLRAAALELFGDVRPREVDAAEWAGGETADLATPSLFGEARGLLVSNARALRDEAVTELRRYVSAADPNAILVLTATVGERAKPPAGLLKLVEGAGSVREVRLQRKELGGWIGKRATATGLNLAPEGVQALTETIGEDPAALDQARRFSLDELVLVHERVAWADRALKSGATDDVVMPLVIAAIAGDPVDVPVTPI